MHRYMVYIDTIHQSKKKKKACKEYNDKCTKFKKNCQGCNFHANLNIPHKVFFPFPSQTYNHHVQSLSTNLWTLLYFC